MKRSSASYCRFEYSKEIEWIRRKHQSEIIYSQDWNAYNKTQTSEFAMFQDILIELLDSLIITNKPIRQGRPFNDLKEMIFCCVMRAYYGKSSRRCVSFLDYAVSKGYISKKPHFNTILNYYKETAMTDILKCLVERTASLPYGQSAITNKSNFFGISFLHTNEPVQSGSSQSTRPLPVSSL